jgi:hypothetical protein
MFGTADSQSNVRQAHAQRNRRCTEIKDPQITQITQITVWEVDAVGRIGKSFARTRVGLEGNQASASRLDS